MSKIHLSKAESWDAIYKASKFINFTSFDYATVKQSLIDYFKLMHPEFNNWIETDEFVMNIEAFAYICELYSYRLDMLSNENLLSLAQRKDSVLQLAKFISYKPSRNKPGIGLVKITSISTSENVFDINGNNLAKTNIIWNDASNPNWKHQFFAVMNSVIKQSFGDVEPLRRKQVYDQVYELYTFNNVPLVNCVIPYKVSLQNITIPMNLVSIDLTNDGPIEQRPHTNNQFNIVYSTDGLGDTSANTGFFILTKQGDLTRYRHSFTDLTPHAYAQPNATNINDIDVWVNEVEVNASDETKNILKTPLWVETDTTNAQNVIFSDNSSQYRYEIETLINDGIKIWFGDDDYAKIPYGDFDIWYRTSLADPKVIPESAINNITSSVNYLDANKSAQVLTFSFSLFHPIQNASASEDIDHIKINAPATYYTQNRMVTARDYNSYMLRDSAILKLKSINRTYVGASKYTELHDSSDTYQNITHLGTDLSLYVNEYTETLHVSISNSPLTVITNYIQPLLSDMHASFYRLKNNLVNRRYFTNTELHAILFDYMGSVYYSTDGNPPNPKFPFAIYGDSLSYIPALVTSSDWLFHITTTKTEYIIKYNAAKLVMHSPTTKFRAFNRGDTITLLSTNPSTKRTKNVTEFLPYNIEFPIFGPKVYDSLNEYNGLPDYSSVEVSINDKNNDGVPDVADLSYLLGNQIDIDLSADDYYTGRSAHRLFNHVFDMPFDSVDVGVPTLDVGYEFLAMDINYVGDVDSTTIVIDEIVNKDVRPVANTITVSSYGLNTKVTITINDYVYFERSSRNDPFVVTNQEVKRQWYTEYQANNHVRYARKAGRLNLSYIWKHVSSIGNRINPSTSNIIDTFIITKGYYDSVSNWVAGNIQNKPIMPTPLDLKTAYGYLTGNKMISDEMILRSGEFKILFGSKADPKLQAKFVVVRSPNSTLTDIQIKISIIDAVNKFFDINSWNFGESFNFTELSTSVHNTIPTQISSFVIVPTETQNLFGNLFQIHAEDNEILIPHITIDDIEFADALTPTVINI